MTSTIRSITIDCAAPTRLAGFWAAATGYVPGEADDRDEVAVLTDPAGGPRLLFLKVPEGKTVKNRVHLDLRPAETMEAEVERLIGLGATRVRVVQESSDDLFTVMQDPEGNEFCVERGALDRRS
ncbi:MAG TPA: VOC family protein [Chloroflexota bacterium]|nr:VOC family protein [Chloroflexota bacterium]